MGHGTNQAKAPGSWAQDNRSIVINVPENLKCATPQARDFLKVRLSATQRPFNGLRLETGGHDDASRTGASQTGASHSFRPTARLARYQITPSMITVLSSVCLCCNLPVFKSSSPGTCV